jgi:uncharacterized PurR-regulated membrane protein YhhQ (DUF165 family)
MRYLNYLYIALYLSAIVVANLLVAYYGPKSVIVVAFFFVGLDLTARDYLHESWSGPGLVYKMGALIAAGSLISYALNSSAGRVALASFVAFLLAAIADTIAYHLLRDRRYMLKINGSNVAGAMVDSIVFPSIAFGALLPVIIIGQFLAKVAGGYLWSLVLRRIK